MRVVLNEWITNQYQSDTELLSKKFTLLKLINTKYVFYTM